MLWCCTYTVLWEVAPGCLFAFVGRDVGVFLGFVIAVVVAVVVVVVVRGHGGGVWVRWLEECGVFGGIEK